MSMSDAEKRKVFGQMLFIACCDGDAAAVLEVLPGEGFYVALDTSGPDFQFSDDKNTPLIVAARDGHTEIVRLLLERAPNTTVDYVNARGCTALFSAAYYNHGEIVRLLANRGGADVNLVGGQQGENGPEGASRATPLGCTALRLAVTPIGDGVPPRVSDPDGARQLATVRVLLRLGAGTLRCHPFPFPSLPLPLPRLPPRLPPFPPRLSPLPPMSPPSPRLPVSPVCPVSPLPPPPRLAPRLPPGRPCPPFPCTFPGPTQQPFIPSSTIPHLHPIQPADYS